MKLEYFKYSLNIKINLLLFQLPLNFTEFETLIEAKIFHSMHYL
jgi:hypothetical protein